MAIQIKRDWAGRPIEITTDKGKKTKNFYLAYIDDVGIFNEEENIDSTLLPFFKGAVEIKSLEWGDKYKENRKKRKELKDKIVQTPRKRWDQTDRDKKHPYDFVIQKNEEKKMMKD